MGEIPREISEAYKTAVNCLRECYSENGIIAGRQHFNDYWARDSFFASFGACKLRDFEIVRKNLLLFLSNQAEDGQIPLRVGTYNIIPKMLGMKGKCEMKPRYTVDTIFSNNLKATDCNSLFVIAMANYMYKSKDINFVKNNFDKIEKALKWNFTQDKDSDLLIEDRGLTTWDDRTHKRGKVLYTNVLHFKALHEMAHLSKVAKKQDKFSAVAKRVRNEINNQFWNGNYYADWIENGKRLDYFCSDGNTLAALWIADNIKIKKIHKSVKRLKIAETFTLKTVSPVYPLTKIYIPNILLGFADYHSGMLWPWISCLYALAISKVSKPEAKKIIQKLGEKIIEYKDCYEVY